jgi:hypothetical protein
MQDEKLWRELKSLPPEGRRRVAKLIALLRKRYQPGSGKNAMRTDLIDEKFIGMWRDRGDLEDSSAWVRTVRESEWGR